jgi:hypothetical protein
MKHINGVDESISKEEYYAYKDYMRNRARRLSYLITLESLRGKRKMDYDTYYSNRRS